MDDDESEHYEKQFYECKTWQMYSRIVDHRLNSPLVAAPIHNNSNTANNDSSNVVSPQVHQHQQGSPASNGCGLIRPKPRYAVPAGLVLPVPAVPQHFFDFAAHQVNDFDEAFDGEVFELDM